MLLLEMSDESCNICYEEFNNNITSTACKHDYHKACILQWCETQEGKNIKPNCPLCRREIFTMESYFRNTITFEQFFDITNNIVLYKNHNLIETKIQIPESVMQSYAKYKAGQNAELEQTEIKHNGYKFTFGDCELKNSVLYFKVTCGIDIAIIQAPEPFPLSFYLGGPLAGLPLNGNLDEINQNIESENVQRDIDNREYNMQNISEAVQRLHNGVEENTDELDDYLINRMLGNEHNTRDNHDQNVPYYATYPNFY